MNALFKHEDGGFLDPPAAAAHAFIVQGGFSTAAIESFRMVEDGVRHLAVCDGTDCHDHIVAAADRALAWIDENAEDPEVQDARRRYELRGRQSWRLELEGRDTHR